MQEKKYHKHPISGRLEYGCLLEPNDIIMAGDLYDSTGGTWQDFPCPGTAVMENSTVIIIRPKGYVD